MEAGKVLRRVALAGVLPCLLLGAGGALGAEEGDIFLPRCGIRYPGGYERHTARTVSGSVEGLELPGSGPVTFRLRTEEELYVVIASPAWYWRDQRIGLADGDAVRVRGSSTIGRDGELYLLAREILPEAGAWVFRLRDEAGRPAWRGCGPGSCASARFPLDPPSAAPPSERP